MARSSPTPWATGRGKSRHADSAFSVGGGRGGTPVRRRRRRTGSRTRRGRTGSSRAARAARISGQWASREAPSAYFDFV